MPQPPTTCQPRRLNFKSSTSRFTVSGANLCFWHLCLPQPICAVCIKPKMTCWKPIEKFLKCQQHFQIPGYLGYCPSRCHQTPSYGSEKTSTTRSAIQHTSQAKWLAGIKMDASQIPSHKGAKQSVSSPTHCKPVGTRRDLSTTWHSKRRCLLWKQINVVGISFGAVISILEKCPILYATILSSLWTLADSSV